MAVSRRIAATVAVAALALSACSSNDAKRSDVVDAMTDAGLTDEQADCIGDGFDAEFDQDTLNDLASASEPADFPEGTEEKVDAIIDECVDGGSGVSTDDETDPTSDSTEASDSTGITDDAGSTSTTGG
jgi:hypothetical protein